MKPFITDERTGLLYELVGDYYFIAGETKRGTTSIIEPGKSSITI